MSTVASGSNITDKTVFPLLESFGEAVFLIDTEGIILTANSAFAAALGKHPDECIDANALDLIAVDLHMPELAGQLREKIRAVLHTGKREVFEAEVKSSIRQVTINPVLSSEKKITRLLVITEDISEKKRAENELEKECALKTAVLDEMPGCAAVLDADGRLILWNKYARQLVLGKEENQSRSIDYKKIISADDLFPIKEKFQNILNSGTDNRSEVRIHPPGSDSAQWVATRGRRIVINGQQCVVAVGMDINEQKRLEEELTESKKRLTFALEATNAGVWEWDLKTDEVIWSERMWTLYGLEPNSLPPSHKLCESTVHPDDREKTFQTIMAAASKETEINVEYRVCHQDGSTHWLMCRGMPLCEADDGMTRYIGTVMDINERKKADIALKENESKFRSIFDHAPLAISIEDIQSGRLIDANASWLELLGYNREEILGKSVSDLGLYADTSEYESISRSLSEHDRVINKPLQLREKSGNLINVLYFSEFITLQDKPVFLVMMTDITLQKTQQQNINQLENTVADRTKKLQEEVKRLQRFLSMISHEYRTPLAIIRSNLDLIKLKNKTGNFSNKQELLKISRAIDRLVEVLEASIQDSRISESQKTSKSIQFRIAQVVTSQVEAFRKIWEEPVISYSGNLGKYEVFGEPSQIKFAIFNLLDNARKYSSTNSPIEVECSTENNDAVIKIRNRCKSITLNEAEAFFGKYHRGSNSANTAGAGLGLWLVRNIINQHSGKVRLEGITSGVEATIRLPIVSKNSSSAKT